MTLGYTRPCIATPTGNMNMRLSKGVTLIELMIVVVVIGILASIAYPAYRNYVVQARRSDGQVALLRAASDMERFYSDCGRYPSALIGARDCTNLGLGYPASPNPPQSPDNYYSLAISAINASGTTYTLTATPLGTQLTNDTDCTTLTLNHLGTKGATGANTTNCWKR